MTTAWAWERTGEQAWEKCDMQVQEVSSDEDDDGVVKPKKGAGLKLLQRDLDLRALAMKLAVGCVDSMPFSDELINAGREFLFTALEFAGSKLPVRERQAGQPFFLAAIEELLRISGDPDSRAYYTSRRSFARGVRVGPGAKLLRVPAVFV